LLEFQVCAFFFASRLLLRVTSYAEAVRAYKERWGESKRGLPRKSSISLSVFFTTLALRHDRFL
jgi:hypothetical protein